MTANHSDANNEMSFAPLKLLQQAIRAVPAVKYALGIAGIIAAIAIVKGFNLDLRIAGFGTIIMLIFMTVLVVFARLTKAAPGPFVVPMVIFTWFAILMTMTVATLLLTSVFWQKPVDLQDWIAKTKTVQEPNKGLTQPLTGASNTGGTTDEAGRSKGRDQGKRGRATPPCMQIDASGKCTSCSFNVKQRDMAGCAGRGGPADYSQVYSCKNMPEGVTVQATLIAYWTTATPANLRGIDIALDEVGGESCPGPNQPCWNRIIDSYPPTNPRMVVVSKTRNGASSWRIRNSHCVVNGNKFCDKCSTVGDATLTITSLGR